MRLRKGEQVSALAPVVEPEDEEVPETDAEPAPEPAAEPS